MKVVIDLAEMLAKGPMNAFGSSKKLFYHAFQETLETQMAMESEYLAERANSKEGREGIAAFIEKREAVYFKL